MAQPRTILYDFVGNSDDPEQLTVQAGDVVTGGDDAGDGWVYITDAHGKTGIVPGSYVGEPVHQSVAVPPHASAPVAPVAEVLVAPPAATAAEEVSGEYEKYARMKRAGLPEGAIRNAMARDGVDPGNFFSSSQSSSGASQSPAASEGGGGNSRSDDPVLEKYKRMEKTGLPEGAIRNAMARDGVDASLMYGGAPQGPPKPVVIAKSQQKSPGAPGGGADLSQVLKQAKLNSTPTQPKTPPKAAAMPVAAAAPKDETSPFDEVKRRALERQHRLEQTGGLLTGESPVKNHPAPTAQSGGASFSPPDKSQWKPNLKKSGGSMVAEQAPPPKESNQPQWSANLKKATSEPPTASKKRNQDDAEVESAPPRMVVYEKTKEPCGEYHVDTAAANFGDCRCGHSKAAHGRAQSHPSPQHSDESHVAVKPLASPLERQAKPCDTYRLDMGAAGFDYCKCGHPKSSHGRHHKADDDSAEDSKPVAKAELGPVCDNYHLGLSAQSYGDCACGHPKAAHFQKESPEKVAHVASSQQSPPSAKATEACATFRIDMTKEFGTCACGFSRAEHDKSRRRSSLDDSSKAPSQPSAKSVRAPRACAQFQLDLTGGFGMCKCGHSRGDHGKKRSSDGSDDEDDHTEKSRKDSAVAVPAVKEAQVHVDSDEVSHLPPAITMTDSVADVIVAEMNAPESLLAETTNQQAGDLVVGEEAQLVSVIEASTGVIADQPIKAPAVVYEKVEEVKHPVSQPTMPTTAPESKPATGIVPRRAAPPPPPPAPSGIVVAGDVSPAVVAADASSMQTAGPRRAAPVPPPVGETGLRPVPPPPGASEAAPPSIPMPASTAAVPRRAAPAPPPGSSFQVPQVSTAPPNVMTQQPSDPAPLHVSSAPPPGVFGAHGAGVPGNSSYGIVQPPPVSTYTNVPVAQQGYAPSAVPAPGRMAPQQPTYAPPPPPQMMMQQQPQYGVVPPLAIQPQQQPMYGGGAYNPMQGGTAQMYNPAYPSAAGQGMPYNNPVPIARPGYSAPVPPMQYQPQPQQPQAPSGNWVCPRCTFDNNAAATECLMCETKRPGLPVAAARPPPAPASVSSFPVAPPQTRAPPRQEWQCRRCTLLNPMVNVKCDACDTPRPAPPATVVPPPATESNPFDRIW